MIGKCTGMTNSYLCNELGLDTVLRILDLTQQPINLKPARGGKGSKPPSLQSA